MTAVPVPGPAADAPATPSRTPGVRRHHWLVRLTHWLNAIVLTGLIASGLQIYGAYARFGLKGGMRIGPNPFDRHRLSALGAARRMARGGPQLALLRWGGSSSVLAASPTSPYLALSGEWRSLLFRPRDIGPRSRCSCTIWASGGTTRPRGSTTPSRRARTPSSWPSAHSVGADRRGASTSRCSSHWLTALFGGYEFARYWHFVAVWLFVAFTLVHVTLVFVVDPASLRAMLTGWYRGRFPSHD